jgi:hypothetical protein
LKEEQKGDKEILGFLHDVQKKLLSSTKINLAIATFLDFCMMCKKN